MRNNYTIRVYAVVINTQEEVLLMEENYKGLNFIKFPGGGLEWGEGTLDCIKRELKEELSLDKVDLKQFYTTDFFQESFFDTQTQVLCVYYKTRNPIIKEDVRLTNKDPHVQGMKWVPINKLSPNHVSFPIDKKVVHLLIHTEEMLP